MAKKTEGNAKTGKNAKGSGCDPTSAAIVHAALTRAADRIKAEHEIGELAPGSYPFDLTVTAKGELMVEQGTPEGEPETVATVSAADLCAAMLAGVKSGDQAGLISQGLGLWKDMSEEQRKAAKAELETLLLAGCKKRKLTTEKAKPGRKGATKSKPSVTVGGTTATRTVRVEVEAA